MLSYRHGFHVGNHADVLKHLCQVLILDYLVAKADKPLAYIDTHAGAGMYSLNHRFATANSEFADGIARLWHTPNLPEPLQRYRDVIRACNYSDQLLSYPGSPAIAAEILSSANTLHLCELHPEDFELLKRWGHKHQDIKIHREDGFKKLIALLPPPQRRALVMIDPPYEVKSDYQTVVDTCQQALKRFASGVYMVWFPLLKRSSGDKNVTTVQSWEWMQKALKKNSQRYLCAELIITDPSNGDTGMYGSGVFVINPPWPLLQQLQQSLPALQTLLGLNASASFHLDHHGLD